MTDANVVLGYIPAGRLASGDLDGLAGARRGGGGAPRRGDRARHHRRRPRDPRARERRDDAGAPRRLDREGPRPRRTSPCSPTAAPGRCTRRRSPPSSASRTAIVPPLAGLFSAAGLLYARAERHDVRFCRVAARDGDVEELRRLEDEMRESLATRRGGRVAARRRRALPRPELEPPRRVAGATSSLAELVDRFEDAHEQMYGTRLDPGSPVDVRALRLVALGPEEHAFSLAHDCGRRRPARRVADFGPAHGTLEVPVRGRSTITADPVAGPLLIDEYDTTVVVPPGWTVALDRGHRRARPHAPSRWSPAAATTRPRSRCGSSRTRSRPPPTRWRRRSSAPRTPRSCATRWTTRRRSAARRPRRSRRR